MATHSSHCCCYRTTQRQKQSSIVSASHSPCARKSWLLDLHLHESNPGKCSSRKIASVMGVAVEKISEIHRTIVVLPWFVDEPSLVCTSYGVTCFSSSRHRVGIFDTHHQWFTFLSPSMNHSTINPYEVGIFRSQPLLVSAVLRQLLILEESGCVVCRILPKCISHQHVAAIKSNLTETEVEPAKH